MLRDPTLSLTTRDHATYPTTFLTYLYASYQSFMFYGTNTLLHIFWIRFLQSGSKYVEGRGECKLRKVTVVLRFWPTTIYRVVVGARACVHGKVGRKNEAAAKTANFAFVHFNANDPGPAPLRSLWRWTMEGEGERRDSWEKFQMNQSDYTHTPIHPQAFHCSLAPMTELSHQNLSLLKEKLQLFQTDTRCYSMISCISSELFNNFRLRSKGKYEEIFN